MPWMVDSNVSRKWLTIKDPDTCGWRVQLRRDIEHDLFIQVMERYPGPLGEITSGKVCKRVTRSQGCNIMWTSKRFITTRGMSMSLIQSRINLVSRNRRIRVDVWFELWQLFERAQGSSRLSRARCWSLIGELSQSCLELFRTEGNTLKGAMTCKMLFWYHRNIQYVEKREPEKFRVESKIVRRDPEGFRGVSKEVRSELKGVLMREIMNNMYLLLINVINN